MGHPTSSNAPATAEQWPDLEPLRLMLVAVTAEEALFELRMAAELTGRGHGALVICRDPAAVIHHDLGRQGFGLVHSEICGLLSLRHEASGIHVVPWESVAQAVPAAPMEDVLAAGLALEEQYGIPNWQIEAVSDHRYEEADPVASARDLHGFFGRWEWLLDRWTPDVVFTGDGGDNIRTSLLHCLRRRGIELFYQGWTPVPDHLYFGNRNQYLLDVRPLDEQHPPREEELQFAQEYISGLRNRSLELLVKRPLPSVVPDGGKVSRLLGGQYSVSAALRSWRGALGRHLRRRRQMAWQRPRYVWPGDEPFAFFPLHMVREAQLSVRAPMYTSQVVPVEMVAHSLPAGMMLYVKEHPNFAGEYPPEFIKVITSLPNVRLMDPSCPSHLAISKSRLVCVINSTAGLESVVLGRPVVCLWRNLYSHWGVTHDCTDLAKLPQVVREALASPVASDEDITSLLCRLRRHAYPGILFVVDLSQGNAMVNARSLLQAIADRRADGSS
jgi:hypothetical protein